PAQHVTVPPGGLLRVRDVDRGVHRAPCSLDNEVDCANNVDKRSPTFGESSVPSTKERDIGPAKVSGTAAPAATGGGKLAAFARSEAGIPVFPAGAKTFLRIAKVQVAVRLAAGPGP